jgi:hypothetical protein
MQSSITNTKLLNTEYVYCMSNASFCHNMVKVGWTRNNPALRANQLFTTGVPTPFVVEFMILTAHGHDLERRLHNHLAKCRVSGSREFFNISVSDLRSVLIEKFSLTLVHLSDVIDQMPKVDTIHKSKSRTRYLAPIKTILPDATTDDDADELPSMFDKYRYRPPSPITSTDDDELSFDRFRYRPS